MGFWETAGKFAKATGEFLQEQHEQHESRLRSKARTLSDDQVLWAVSNGKEQYVRDIAYDEARRRGLV
jgi:hypothetical protein